MNVRKRPIASKAAWPDQQSGNCSRVLFKLLRYLLLYAFYLPFAVSSRRKRPNDDDPRPSDKIPIAEPALCKPELTTVTINASSDPNIFLFPNCVRIERCGGCCNHDLLECQPKEIVMKQMRVVQTTLKGAQ